MKRFSAMVATLLLLIITCYAQQQQQSNPPLGDQSTYPAATHKMSTKEKHDTPAAKGQPVDLNTATKKDLAALPGVGPDYAQTIIDARPFNSKEDLVKKKVVPQATYDKIQDRITANDPKKNAVPEGGKQSPQ
jgi:DNA uptake protein ComE-like DNA-binding protein